MSLNGLGTFLRNLNALMDSAAFKKADSIQQAELGYRLLRSKYGLGVCGVVAPLKTPKHEDEDQL